MSDINELMPLFYERLSQENKILLDRVTTPKRYKKNEYLLQPGQNAAIIFTIEEGIVRNYIFKSDKEITTQFHFKNDSSFSINSYIPHGISDEYIQAITDTEVQVTNLNEFNKHKANDIELMRFEMHFNELFILKQAERLRDFQVLDAKERYLKLLEKEPNIIQKVPLTYIASYLGITLGSLSRIRSMVS